MGATVCFGCGADVPKTQGPVHTYVLAAPGCWELFGSLGDWLNSLERDGTTTAQKVVDTYMVQHPTNPDRRNRQSVAVHLMSLCASLEQGVPGIRLRCLLGQWTRRDYPKLLPHPSTYPFTVRDIVDANEDERPDRVGRWAASTWDAWSDHHDEVREWLADRSDPSAVCS